MLYVDVFSDPDLSAACTQRCESQALECILDCSNGDATCISNCLRKETECIEGERLNICSNYNTSKQFTFDYAAYYMPYSAHKSHKISMIFRLSL